MKPSQEVLDNIKQAWGDWEKVHVICDKAVFLRLRELDPEFTEAMTESTKGATFWYA